MALIFPGKTLCQLCDKVIEKEDKVSAFPAFLPSTHALSKYSDAAFHTTCWDNCTDKEWMEEIYHLYNLIYESRPRDLKTVEEMEAWTKEAFQDWPPLGRVVIFESLDRDADEKFFYMDADSYQAFCEEEDKAQKELEERREEAYRREREMWRYVRDDD